MASATKYTGSGHVTEADVKYVKWVGKTKGGKSVLIEMENAICLSNPDWAFAEKDDTVPEIKFTGLYDDDKLAVDDRTEPWTLTLDGETVEGNAEILLGVGRFYVGTSSSDAQPVGLTRGGGQFVVEREYRAINADGDPGMVKDRIEQEAGQPKLKMNTLQWLTKVATLYAAMKTVSE